VCGFLELQAEFAALQCKKVKSRVTLHSVRVRSPVLRVLSAGLGVGCLVLLFFVFSVVVPAAFGFGFGVPGVGCSFRI
jgi:hypothetical protein